MMIYRMLTTRLFVAFLIIDSLPFSPAPRKVAAQGVCPEDTGGTHKTSPKTLVSWDRRSWRRLPSGVVQEIPSIQARTSYRPTTRGEIVELIEEAEADGGRIKWQGSLWAYESVAVPGSVEVGPDTALVTDGTMIETDAITGLISNSLFLDNLDLTNPAGREELVHIKGGTKVYNMNRLLHLLPELDPLADNNNRDDERNLSCNETHRAFPTLGGAGGQSVAGLMATGSHGGDVGLPPMADFTQAIHLIGPGGQEFWIERSSGLTTGSALDTQAILREIVDTNPDAEPEMCRDIIVKKDDDLFNAVLVSVGRMGLVYSLVVKTEPAFKLRERRYNAMWEDLLQFLHPSTVFQAFVALKNLHFLQILINPFPDDDGNYKIKVTEREIIEDCASEESAAPSMAPNDDIDIGGDIFSWVCSQQDFSDEISAIILAAVAALSVTIATLLGTVAGLQATVGAVLAIPFVGPIIAAGIQTAIFGTLAAITAATAASVALTGLAIYASAGGLGRTPGELVGEISRVLFDLDMPDLVRQILTQLFDTVYPERNATDVGWKLMDAYDYENEDFCLKVEAMEVAFDVARATNASSGYLAWLEEVLTIFDDMYSRKIAVAGLLALRYTTNTESLIGMSKFPTTVHVEVPLLENFAGNSEFLDRIQTAAIRYGGVPSWGQQMATYTKSDISDLHGEDLKTWQRSLALLISEGGGNDFTFSNDFTTFYGLEPIAYEEVRFTITLGDDSLGDTNDVRSDVSEDFVLITFDDGEFVQSPLNDGMEWPAFSTNIRIVSLGPGKMWEDVDSISIEHQAAGDDCCADNWKMNQIVVTSIAAEDGSEREELDLSGDPIWYFKKNSEQIWTYSFP